MSAHRIRKELQDLLAETRVAWQIGRQLDAGLFRRVAANRAKQISIASSERADAPDVEVHAERIAAGVWPELEHIPPIGSAACNERPISKVRKCQLSVLTDGCASGVAVASNADLAEHEHLYRGQIRQIKANRSPRLESSCA